MKRRLLASLLLALLLSGCTARTEAPKESAELPPPVEIHAETPPQTEEKPLVTVNGTESTTLTDGDMETVTHFPDGGSINIAWKKAQNIDRIYLQGLTEGSSVVISTENGELYRQEMNSGDRWCYVGKQTAQEVSITLSAESSLAEISFSAAPEGHLEHLSAYLPVSSFTQQMLTDGTLDGLDELTINTGCYWLADGSLEVQTGLPELFSQIHEQKPELKLYCTINPKRGAASAIYTEEQRKILIEHMLDFCTEQQLAGVDIDWEFPAENEWEAFSDFLVELSEALKSANLRLSLAFYPEDIHLSPEAVKAISKVNVMAYDQFDEEGRHSTYSCAEKSIEYFLELGFAPEQLSLGIPAYGRPLSAEAQWPLYREYADALADGSNQIDNFYFNSPQLAQDKAVFAAAEQLHGVFLYHLGCDLPGNDERSLTKAVGQVLS